MRKLIAGIPTTEADWDEHLLEYHRRDPGGTPRSFAQWRSSSGLSSYEMLVEAASPRAAQKTGCASLTWPVVLLSARLAGRAKLIGLDVSATELEAARSRLQGHDVELLQGRVQELRIPDRSIDAVVCHMAIMLMSPVEPVVREIARVLRPGGPFAAVVNRGPAVGPAAVEDAVLATSSRCVNGFLAREYPSIGRPRTGDQRARSQEGLREMFSSGTGYRQEVEVRAFDLLIETSPEGLADFWLSTYVVGALPAEKQEQLEGELMASLAQHQLRDGSLRMAFPMWIVLARSVASAAR